MDKLTQQLLQILADTKSNSFAEMLDKPANEIIAELVRQDASWHPKTARTLLSRLVQKGALDYEAQGRLYVYEPRVREVECVAAASKSFLERVFGGSLTPMLAHFVQHRKLTPQELRELRELLDRGAKSKPTGRKS